MSAQNAQPPRKVPETKPRRLVYGIEAIRSGRGVDIQFDLGETLLTMSERMFLDSIHGPSYGGDPGDRDVWLHLSGEWKPFRVPESAWWQYAQTRHRIREEDIAALQLAATKEGEIVSAEAE